ncbi:ubiE/COQ5 methyltransferase family-domain-containing protein [Xylariaceae sp. FL0804]|nr:ubiE/COQ5 methyltransferase family-domain-containing protein [Xylariaceae sp. FL0804]
MAARPAIPVLRTAARACSHPPPSTCSNPSFRPSSRHVRTFCTNTPLRTPSTGTSTGGGPGDDRSTRTTHFGFQDGLSESEKTERVADVFHRVADSYDRMNDLMSLGWHRVWKDHFVSSLNPGLSASHPPAPQRILDVAGGTGDIAFRLLRHAHDVHGNPDVRVVVSDINPSMLGVGRARADARLPASQRAACSFLEADATALPRAAVPDASVDLYTVAFGIRNFSNVPAALREAHRVLRPGGVFACLEFSRVAAGRGLNGLGLGLLDAAYDRWSFGAIPLLGQLVAGDRDSYQYLVESIRRFPDQERFAQMIRDAGFVVAGDGYENLTGGIAAIHRGMKPLA